MKKIRKSNIPTFVRTIQDKLCEEYNITYETCKDITESPFRYCAEKIKEGDRGKLNFYNIRIINFGVFSVAPGRLNALKDDNKKNKNSTTEEDGNKTP